MRNTLGACRCDVGRAHIDHARQAEARANGGRGDAVLAGAGLGDDAGLAHALGEQDLAEAIVDLVRAGVVELLALEIDLGAAEMLRSAARRNRAGSAGRYSACRDGRARPGSRDRSWPRSSSSRRSRISGISVSATKRPPNMPNMPCSSGPVRKEFGSTGLFMPCSSIAAWKYAQALAEYRWGQKSKLSQSQFGSSGCAFRLRDPDGPEKGLDQRRLLDARRALDARRNVDAGWVRQPQGPRRYWRR